MVGLLIQTSQYDAQACNLVNVEFVVALENVNVARRNVDGNINVTGLQRHSAGIRVVNRRNFNSLIGNFAIPIIFVAFHDGAFLDETFNHVRAGANGAFLAEIASRFGGRVDDNKQRVGKVAGHTWQRIFRLDNQILSVRSNRFILKESCGASVLCKGAFDRIFYGLGSEGRAVGKFHVVADFERPRQVIVADLPTFSKPRLNIHLLIKLG